MILQWSSPLIRFPTEVKAKPLIGALWPGRVAIGCREARSQTMVVQSSPADARARPSRLKANDVAPAAVKWRTLCPADATHRCAGNTSKSTKIALSGRASRPGWR